MPHTPLALLFVAATICLICHAPTHAQGAAAAQDEWLTIHGFPDQPQGDLIQVSPTPVPWQDRFTIDIRASRSTLRDGYHQFPYRSFKAVAVIDCSSRKGWYLTIQYFTQPMWQGPTSGPREFKENEAPVAFNGIPGEPARRLVAAACKPR